MLLSAQHLSSPFPPANAASSLVPTVHVIPLLWASHRLSRSLFWDPRGLSQGQAAARSVEALCELVEGALSSAEPQLIPLAGCQIQNTSCTSAVENGGCPVPLPMAGQGSALDFLTDLQDVGQDPGLPAHCQKGK